MNRKTLLGALLILALAVGGFLAVRYTRRVSEQLQSSTDGNAATGKPSVRFVKNPRQVPDLTMTTLDGKTISTKDLAGKVVIFNFWATWCAPCRAEIPDLVKLQDQYKDQLVIIGVLSEDDPGPHVSRFAADYKINYPIVPETKELQAVFTGIYALPTTTSFESGAALGVPYATAYRALFQKACAAPDDVVLVPDFFTAANYRKSTDKQAQIVTSIAMFYDLDDPVAFARQIEQSLAEDGIWHFEQSYMPSMLRLNSYDTICHEHLEYYSLRVVQTIVEAAGMKVVDVIMNNVNGGSFAVTATKKRNSSVRPNNAVIDWLLEQEDRMGINTPRPYRDFEERVFRHRDDLIRLIRALRDDGKTVLGYGASTKGNVVLQFCGFGTDDIPAIADVNPEKFGRVTPGTHIPIISEADAKKMNPDYYLVLPWHFKEGILRREKEYLSSGGKFIFPFPEIEII